MPQEDLSKSYAPAEIEGRWRARWEEGGVFSPSLPAAGETYSIVIPPPTVTGNLHIGHAFNLTLQDLLCRHARQLGKTVLWVPGEDHAGIATQNVVERRLAAEGTSRHELGREAFVRRIWQWKEEYGENIRRQIKAMGASVDWSRERFTMDDGLSRAVRRVFARLYKEGLIYKGDYITNWCPRCHTALADDEVEHAPKRGTLWFIRYPLADGSGFVTIATTRPETIPGDSAVAVNPEDVRYQSLIGKTLLLPLLNRPIPLIADAYVDREFGTGALKVTPAHDHNDWKLGRKHHLEFIRAIDEDDRMTAAAGSFAGKNKMEARELILQGLTDLGLLQESRECEHNVGHCYRCKEVIEPRISTQWFVSVRPLAEKARAAVPGRAAIYPESWLKTYYNWLDNIRDWCISRQIWWGHRIPAWTCAACGELLVEEEAPAACPRCHSTDLNQEEDVLDTWFSSALWPFSTLGWPEKTAELKAFYPTSVLVTGFDILFFWVARMLMMGLHFMNDVPFREVYIHALVRDADGKKMSKSTGNVIDPLEMIAKYGADALRFTLTAFAAMGRDIKLAENRIEGYRHFINKIWNAARFTLLNLPAQEDPMPDMPLESIHGEAHAWILHRLEEIKTRAAAAVKEYRFNDLAQELYKFVWSEFCDWYLEMIKADMQAGGAAQAQARRALLAVMRETLLLLHPIIPFVTAEIWSALPRTAQDRRPDDITQAPYPAARPGCLRPETATRMEVIQSAIVAARTIRAELNIAPSAPLCAIIRPQDAPKAAILEANREMITRLARLGSLHLNPDAPAPKLSARQVAAGSEVIICLEGAIDPEAERARLDKELNKLAKERLMLQSKLANENYTQKAPADLVERDRLRVEEIITAENKLKTVRDKFNT
ncbi:MAG: valine--tRNA ligase [Deltaproteobacteria bacterium]|jgi:valyl-tRNA synthetase|nr:valine--tRNA ligase [Deltaproteobacteria bacterium]